MTPRRSRSPRPGSRTAARGLCLNSGCSSQPGGRVCLRGAGMCWMWGLSLHHPSVHITHCSPGWLQCVFPRDAGGKTHSELKMYKNPQQAKWKAGVNWNTCTGCPPWPSHGGGGSGGSPTLQEGTGGWQGPPSWPHIQAASYLLCYHLASSSPSTAGSIKGRGCFPQGISSVGKLR